MKRNLISLLLLACLLGCGYVMRHAMLAEGYLGDNVAGNLDLLAGELGLTLVGSHYTGIAMVVTCLLGLVLVWGRWQGPSRGMWLVAAVTLLLGGCLILDSTLLHKAFREVGRQAAATATFTPVKVGNWLWYEEAGLAGGVAALPHYVVFLFRHKALASAISLGLLLIGNLLIERPRSATAVPPSH
jgi:uncharacterized protein YceK